MAKILLVEDDLDLALIVTDSLSAEEHVIEHAATGPAARDRLLADTYEVVILDWDLPGITGYEILREFRGRGGTTPIIMLTGRNSFEEKEQGLDAGADDYLTKPFGMRELRARVRALLRRAAVVPPVGVSPPQQEVAAVAPSSAPMTAPATVYLGAGALLDGKYLLEEPIGQGGSAVVWRATHIVLNRPVVVKMLAGHLVDNSVAVDRFMQECHAMARLNNPNIIAIFEVGVVNKAPFLVMEYASGMTIRKMIETHGAAPVRVALEIISQVCRGLQAAHKAGIIHRDLKPENIIIQDMKESHFVKIADFGISHLIGAERLTDEGTVVGTLEYISPEQIEEAELDCRSDLYAVGIILFEMLTGRLPFESKTPHALLIKKVQQRADPIWSRRGDILPDSAVDKILQKCLEKNPDLRYQTADELRLEIERVLATQL